LKQHVFFESIDWIAIEYLEVEPPNILDIHVAEAIKNGESELGPTIHFHEGFTGQNISYSVVEETLSNVTSPNRSRAGSDEKYDGFDYAGCGLLDSLRVEQIVYTPGYPMLSIENAFHGGVSTRGARVLKYHCLLVQDDSLPNVTFLNKSSTDLASALEDRLNANEAAPESAASDEDDSTTIDLVDTAVSSAAQSALRKHRSSYDDADVRFSLSNTSSMPPFHASSSSSNTSSAASFRSFLATKAAEIEDETTQFLIDLKAKQTQSVLTHTLELKNIKKQQSELELQREKEVLRHAQQLAESERAQNELVEKLEADIVYQNKAGVATRLIKSRQKIYQ
jgi:hypothetical protein